jgi:UDP:flavonoid glycosyltransferase YjiC (YdhE family)
MRILMACVGTRGDVQPYIALGRAFIGRGHRVVIATHREFEDFVTDHGVQFAPIAGDSRAGLRGEAGGELLRNPRGTLRNVRLWQRVLSEQADQAVRDCYDAARDADVIMGSPLGVLVGYNAAEACGLPLVRAYYGPPFVPTGEVPAGPIPAQVSLGPRLNRLSWVLARQFAWQLARPWANRHGRKPLGLSPFPVLCDPFSSLDRQRSPVVCGYSEAVVPRRTDWPEYIHVTGYWFVPGPIDSCPPSALDDFVHAESPPVYIGFGSMPGYDTDALITCTSDAVRTSGCRALLFVPDGDGNGEPKVVSDDLMTIGDVSFEWLFPRVAAVVQHGGAGTVGAALAAGKPTQVIPFLADQHFWAARVTALGVGPKPLLPDRLNSATLANAMTTLTTDDDMRRKAAALGARIRAEDGVGTAVSVIEEYVQNKSAAFAARVPRQRARALDMPA